MATAGHKDPGALLTIGELSLELGVAQHILRYWETKFPLRPMQRAGNRRYYRPDDVALARRINRLLNEEGYTVRGVQKLLRGKSEPAAEVVQSAPAPPSEPAPALEPVSAFIPGPEPAAESASGIEVFRLIALRDRLARALED